MELCPRCGNVLKDGFCDACGYPVGWIKVVFYHVEKVKGNRIE